MPSMREIRIVEHDDDHFVLSCGCRGWADEEIETFIFAPCSRSCEMFAYVVAETERQGKPVTEIDAS